MEYIIILAICILSIFIIKFALNIKISDLKKVKKIGFEKDLNKITNHFPENKVVCKEMLKMLNNNDVTIEESNDKNSKVSFYMVVTNKIIIANIQETFTRIQTIAHECIHSIQNKKILLFNFIYSNLYILYFFIASILTIFNVIKQPVIQIIILIILGFIYYIVRSYLETDAMTRAPYIAEKYMKESKKSSDENIKEIISNYSEINKIGIPMVNFRIAFSVLIKIIIYCIIALVVN